MAVSDAVRRSGSLLLRTLAAGGLATAAWLVCAGSAAADEDHADEVAQPLDALTVALDDLRVPAGLLDDVLPQAAPAAESAGSALPGALPQGLPESLPQALVPAAAQAGADEIARDPEFHLFTVDLNPLAASAVEPEAAFPAVVAMSGFPGGPSGDHAGSYSGGYSGEAEAYPYPEDDRYPYSDDSEYTHPGSSSSGYSHSGSVSNTMPAPMYEAKVAAKAAARAAAEAALTPAPAPSVPTATADETAA
ncbi:hypothetical protein, partial [Saccharothrix hoggarensis]